MKHALVALAIFSGSALATPTFKADGLVVRLPETPCAAPVVDLIQDAYKPQFQTAEVFYRGKQLRAGWIFTGQSVVIVDEMGEGGEIPAMAGTGSG